MLASWATIFFLSTFQIKKFSGVENLYQTTTDNFCFWLLKYLQSLISACGEKKEREDLFLKIALAHCFHKSQPSQGLLPSVAFLRKWMKIWARTQTGRLEGHICPAGPTSLNSYCAVGIGSALGEGTPLPCETPLPLGRQPAQHCPALEVEAALCGVRWGMWAGGWPPHHWAWGHMVPEMICASLLSVSSLKTFNLPRGKVPTTS